MTQHARRATATNSGRNGRWVDATRIGYPTVMSVLLIVLAVIVLLAFGVLGAILEGLLWLTLIAAIIFVVGAVFGYFRLKGSRSA